MYVHVFNVMKQGMRNFKPVQRLDILTRFVQ